MTKRRTRRKPVTPAPTPAAGIVEIHMPTPPAFRRKTGIREIIAPIIVQPGQRIKVGALQTGAAGKQPSKPRPIRSRYAPPGARTIDELHSHRWHAEASAAQRAGHLKQWCDERWPGDKSALKAWARWLKA